MRLEDVNALVEARRVAAREYGRLFGCSMEDALEPVKVRCSSELTDLSRIVDKPIKRTDFDEGGAYLSVDYQGQRFECVTGVVD